MKKVLVIIAALLNVASVWGQNRVYWVHGLNDNDSTWITYKTELVPLENRGSSLKWYSRNSLRTAASSLNSRINREMSLSGKAIVFGHSAGGLVARQAAQKNTKIRAVITAGTPNNGAGIVTSLKNQSFNNVADRAIGKINISTIMGDEAVAATFLPGVITSICSVYQSISKVVNEVLLALAYDKIEETKNDFSSLAAVKDMNPNLAENDFLQNLNSSAPRVPIINLYGNEDDNRLVRIAGTALHKEENDSPSNTTDACYDETVFPFYNSALTTCTMLEVLHSTASSLLNILGTYIPVYRGASTLHSSASSSWADTKRYIQFDVHNEWDEIIGAVHTDSIENWHRFLWWTWCDVEYVTVYEDSDGFIPNKSSMMDESKGPNTKNHEIPGVNHLEMNSHSSMRDMLDDILSKGVYGEVFSYN